jgi:hypothetical protein
MAGQQVGAIASAAHELGQAPATLGTWPLQGPGAARPGLPVAAPVLPSRRDRTRSTSPQARAAAVAPGMASVTLPTGMTVAAVPLAAGGHGGHLQARADCPQPEADNIPVLRAWSACTPLIQRAVFCWSLRVDQSRLAYMEPGSGYER